MPSSVQLQNGSSGKVAVITGAARGIGRAVCVAFAQSDAHVAGIDICAEDAARMVTGAAYDVTAGDSANNVA